MNLKTDVRNIIDNSFLNTKDISVGDIIFFKDDGALFLYYVLEIKNGIFKCDHWYKYHNNDIIRYCLRTDINAFSSYCKHFKVKKI